jgi:DNA-directed RNA polymerase I subunit RPA1
LSGWTFSWASRVDDKTQIERVELEVYREFEPSKKRLLLVSLADRAAEKSVVRQSTGINAAYVIEREGGDDSDNGAMAARIPVPEGAAPLALQTEGSHFSTLWELAAADADGAPEAGNGGAGLALDALETNDIYGMLTTYGVEAARATIVQEIRSVFGVYGIGVDIRHLGLIADYMTFTGSYRAFNRLGMQYASSPYLQMSYESTATFLTAACISGASDRLKSPSASVVLGKPAHVGTSAFDLVAPSS